MIFCFFTLLSRAHPGIGIVKDSKGNIYYTDLQQVWKISKGMRTIAVPNVHTHELYIDANDNLYGENQQFVDERTNRFDHYFWMLSPEGKLDTIVEQRQAFVFVDFSLARDLQGNEYYTKYFLRSPDSGKIFKKTPQGRETIFAVTPISCIHWLHPQKDGSLLFTGNNNIYRAKENDTARLIVKNIASRTPRFWGEGIVLYGLWMDDSNNIYAAVFSDQAIKKITPEGNVTEVYRSEKNWAPTHGLFDQQGRLWVMECSDRNEIRVTKAGSVPAEQKSTTGSARSTLVTAAVILVVIAGIVLLFINASSKDQKTSIHRSPS